MKVVLKKGESVDIAFEDADGSLRIGYGHTKVFVKAELPDTQGRQGIIYEENFGGVKGRRARLKLGLEDEESDLPCGCDHIDVSCQEPNCPLKKP